MRWAMIKNFGQMWSKDEDFRFKMIKDVSILVRTDSSDQSLEMILCY